MKEVTLVPETWTVGGMGPSSEGQPVKFKGEKIAEYSTHWYDATAWETWDLYRTEGGKFVLFYCDYSRWEGSRESKTVHVFKSLDEIPTYDPTDAPGYYDMECDDAAVPIRLIVEAKEALGEDPAIYID